MQVRFCFTETGSIAITRWLAPEGKKPSHYPAKSSFPFFGVEPCLIEENPILEVCNLLIYVPTLTSVLSCHLLMAGNYLSNLVVS